MACEEAALAYLSRNKLRYVDMLEPLRRGSAELLYAGADGVLLYDREVEAHMLAAVDPAALEKMLPLMAGGDRLVGHQLWYQDALAAPFGLEGVEPLAKDALAGWQEKFDRAFPHI